MTNPPPPPTYTPSWIPQIPAQQSACDNPWNWSSTTASSLPESHVGLSKEQEVATGVDLTILGQSIASTSQQQPATVFGIPPPGDTAIALPDGAGYLAQGASNRPPTGGAVNQPQGATGYSPLSIVNASQGATGQTPPCGTGNSSLGGAANQPKGATGYLPSCSIGYPVQGATGYPTVCGIVNQPQGATGYSCYPPQCSTGFPQTISTGQPTPSGSGYSPPDNAYQPAGPYSPPGPYPPGSDYPPYDPEYPPPASPDHIPLILASQPAKNQKLKLVEPIDVPEIIIAEGQRKIIDQIDTGGEDLGKCTCKNGCALLWSTGSQILFFVCIWLLVTEVQKKYARQRYDEYEVSNYWRTEYVPEPPHHSEATIICAAIFLVLSLLIYLLEGSCSDTLSYVSNVLNLEQSLRYVKLLREAKPQIKWKVKCSHEEVHYKSVTRYHNGERRTETKREVKNIVTYEEDRYFQYAAVTDASGDIRPIFTSGNVTRVELDKTFGFLDYNIMARYEAEKQQFKENNMHRDDNLTFTEDFLLGEDVELNQRITVYADKRRRAECMKERYFWCTLVTCLTWPYRLWFRSATNKRKFTIVKLLGDDN